MGKTDGWRESTEGDLDPDLVEEAPYGAWDPPPPRGGNLALRTLSVLGLLALLGGALLTIVGR